MIHGGQSRFSCVYLKPLLLILPRYRAYALVPHRTAREARGLARGPRPRRTRVRARARRAREAPRWGGARGRGAWRAWGGCAGGGDGWDGVGGGCWLGCGIVRLVRPFGWDHKRNLGADLVSARAALARTGVEWFRWDVKSSGHFTNLEILPVF